MTIRAVDIQNFRTYKDVKITVSEEITLIIGENDVGKSSFFDAIKICCNRLNLDEKDFRESDKPLIIAMEAVNWTFKLTASIKEEKVIVKKNIKFKLKYISEMSNFLTTNEDQDAQFLSEIKKWLIAIQPKRKEEIASGEANILNLFNDIFKNSDHNYELGDAKKNVISPIKLIHLADGQYTDLPLFFKETYFNDFKDKIINNKEIKEAIDKEIKDTEYLVSSLVSKDENIKNSLTNYLGESVDSLNLKITDHDMDIKFKIDVNLVGPNGNVSYQNRSDGIKKRLTLALLEAAGGATSVKGGTSFESITNEVMFLLDEPDGSLHVKAQLQMFEQFKSIAKSSKNQVLVATHSPFLVNSAHVRDIRIIKRWKNITNPIELTGDSNSEELNKCFKAIGLENTNIFFSKAIILVEGISDKEFLDNLFIKLFEESIENNLIKIISVDGCQNIPGFVTALSSIYDERMYVVLDGDCQKNQGSSCIGKPEPDSVSKKVLKAFNTSYQSKFSDVIKNNLFFVGTNELEDEFEAAVIEKSWLNYLKKKNPRFTNNAPKWNTIEIEKALLSSKNGDNKFSDELKSLNTGNSGSFCKIELAKAIVVELEATKIPENVLKIFKALKRDHLIKGNALI